MKPFKVNHNLISLKCVLFLFFGGLGSLMPFMSLHMTSLGLSKDESVTASVIVALVATIGPLIAAPLADRFGGSFENTSKNKNGRYLRIMIALCLIFSVVFYWLITAIPKIKRSPLDVSFMCNEEGGYILQDKCDADESSCYNWGDEKGSVLVTNCEFTCNDTTPQWKSLKKWTTTPRPTTTTTEKRAQEPEVEIDNEAVVYEENDDTLALEDNITSSTLPTSLKKFEIDEGNKPYPHMCYKYTENGNNTYNCKVFTEYTENLEFHLGLYPSNIDDDEYCSYKFADEFSCRIPEKVKSYIWAGNCDPIIACEIHWPYNNTNSLLQRSQCGYNNISYYLYVLIRSIADIFPMAALVLIDTAVVIATRETSTGRSDIGKQFAAGALGLVIFPPLLGWLGNGTYLPALISYSICMIVAAFILLCDNKMPLSPPEWWWHTRCGLLALPMSSVRKFGLETAGVGLVIFLLGMFWNSIDAFLPWHIIKLQGGTELLIGLTYSIAAIPSTVYLLFAETIVDYCGHSNLLILCFVSYILHHIGLVVIKEASLILILELLELLTLHLMWITAILYMRHLVPRKFTACGQALPVIAHFCLGRALGAYIGGLAYNDYPNNFMYINESLSVWAAIIASIYFVLYHFYLKFYCLPPPQLPPYPAPSVTQAVNGNGTYTPLRVYHNDSSKKGHFRY